MSDDKTSVDWETKSQKSENSKDKCLPVLSDFAKKTRGPRLHKIFAKNQSCWSRPRVFSR